MRVSDFISAERVLLKPVYDSKRSLLEGLVEASMKSEIIQDSGVSLDIIKNAVFDRESLSSTGVGNGYAFPHARIEGIGQAVLVLGILDNPVDYESLDGEPVNVICLTLTPADNPVLSVKVMSLFGRFFADKEKKNSVFTASTSRAVYDIIKKADLDLDIAVTAFDIMRKPLFDVYNDTPLRDITHMMSRRHLQAVPVIEHSGKLVGEISCNLLFQIGLPDFFTQLKSVSFIDEFDPFEKYFEQEISAVAEDVMDKNFARVNTKSTILEIVFELAVKGHQAIYVEKDDKLVGVIDKSTVLDRIINA